MFSPATSSIPLLSCTSSKSCVYIYAIAHTLHIVNQAPIPGYIRYMLKVLGSVC